MPTEDEIETPSDAASDQAPAEGTSPAASSAPSEAPDWDEDFSTLDKQPWWNEHVPEKARAALTKLHEDRTYLNDLVRADEPVALLQEKYNGLERALGAEVTEWKGKHAALAAEHETLRTDYNRVSDDLENVHLSTRDAEVKSAFPDIYAAVEKDDKGVITGGALVEFAKLTAQGIPDDRAAKMVRAAYDMPTPGAPPPVVEEPPPRQKETPPASVTAMGRGGANAAEAGFVPPPAKLTDKIRQMQREIEASEG